MNAFGKFTDAELEEALVELGISAELAKAVTSTEPREIERKSSYQKGRAVIFRSLLAEIYKTIPDDAWLEVMDEDGQPINQTIFTSMLSSVEIPLEMSKRKEVRETVKRKFGSTAILDGMASACKEALDLLKESQKS